MHRNEEHRVEDVERYQVRHDSYHFIIRQSSDSKIPSQLYCLGLVAMALWMLLFVMAFDKIPSFIQGLISTKYMVK